MNDDPKLRLDPDPAVKSFSSSCDFCEESANELGERLQFLQHVPKRIVNASFRSSSLSRFLRSRFPDSSVVAIDEPLNRSAQVKDDLMEHNILSVTSDMGRQPIDTGSADLIVSNLAASFYDPKTFLSECYRVLNTDGVLLFAMFGTQSFNELRQACIDSGIAEGYQAFPEMHDIGDLLLATGFTNPVVDMESKQPRYTDIQSLIECLELSGVLSLLMRDFQLSPSKSVQSNPIEQYYAPDENGEITATLEIIYGIAWKKQFDTDSTHVHFHPTSR